MKDAPDIAALWCELTAAISAAITSHGAGVPLTVAAAVAIEAIDLAVHYHAMRKDVTTITNARSESPLAHPPTRTATRKTRLPTS